MKARRCILNQCRRMAEWKCASAKSQRSGNPQGKGANQTLIGGDVARSEDLLVGGTTFGIPQLPTYCAQSSSFETLLKPRHASVLAVAGRVSYDLFKEAGIEHLAGGKYGKHDAIVGTCSGLASRRGQNSTWSVRLSSNCGSRLLKAPCRNVEAGVRTASACLRRAAPPREPGAGAVNNRRRPRRAIDA